MFEEFNVRLAEMSDIKKVFELSNDDIVRKNSVNKKNIKWEEHEKWFSDRIKNTDYPFYIAESSSGDFIAQVRFDKKDNEVIVSISLTEKYRAKGLSDKIIKACIEKSGFDKVSAYIYDYNIPSIKTFKKAGFVQSRLLKFEFTREIERERERVKGAAQISKLCLFRQFLEVCYA